MMSIPPYTSIAAGLQRTRATDLDRYVRAEFGDRDGAWLAYGGRPNHSNRRSSKSEDDGRLLRRLTLAISIFFLSIFHSSIVCLKSPINICANLAFLYIGLLPTPRRLR